MKEHLQKIVEMYLPDELKHFEEWYEVELPRDYVKRIILIEKLEATDHIVYPLLKLDGYCKTLKEDVKPEQMVCGYCGEEGIYKDKDGNTHCVSTCYNTDIISWSDYCDKDSRAIVQASEEADEAMKEQFGEKYGSLIYEEDNVIHYTEEGQDIYDELFDEYYSQYMQLH